MCYKILNFLTTNSEHLSPMNFKIKNNRIFQMRYKKEIRKNFLTWCEWKQILYRRPHIARFWHSFSFTCFFFFICRKKKKKNDKRTTDRNNIFIFSPLSFVFITDNNHHTIQRQTVKRKMKSDLDKKSQMYKRKKKLNWLPLHWIWEVRNKEWNYCKFLLFIWRKKNSTSFTM